MYSKLKAFDIMYIQKYTNDKSLYSLHNTKSRDSFLTNVAFLFSSRGFPGIPRASPVIIIK